MRYSFLLLSFVLTHVVFAQTTSPVATDDTFNTTPGGLLTVEAPGVLVNDTDAEGDSLAAVLLTEPANGTLTLNRDGSFTYTPNNGFTGTDTFTYLAEEVTPESFSVDQTQSGIRFETSLSIPGLGDESDSDSSSVRGTITADVTPNTMPFAEIHITGMNLTLADSLDLSFRFGIIGGRLDAVTEPDSMVLTVVQPGAPAEIADSAFTQTANEVGIAGTLNLDASGLIALAVQDGPQQIEVMALDDLTGFITQRDTTLRLGLPLELEGTFDVTGNAVDVVVQGFLAATAPILPAPLTSNAATVSIVVEVNTTAEEAAEVPARFALEQNYPNPFNPVTTIVYALPTPSAVSLTVYDALGRKVATLTEAYQAAGRHSVRFDAGSLPGGVYVYRLQAGSFTAAKTFVVLK